MIANLSISLLYVVDREYAYTGPAHFLFRQTELSKNLNFHYSRDSRNCLRYKAGYSSIANYYKDEPNIYHTFLKTAIIGFTLFRQNEFNFSWLHIHTNICIKMCIVLRFALNIVDLFLAGKPH